MLKANNWLVWIVVVIIGLYYNPTPLLSRHYPDGLDTSKLIKHIRTANHKAAVDYLTDYLNRQQAGDNPEFGSVWLNLAIFLAWDGRVQESEIAFTKYDNVGSLKTNPLLKSNQLLYHSLVLAIRGSNNQAADSLMASISLRQSVGELDQLILADSYGELARLFKKTGDLFESSRNFERSISLNRKLIRTEVLAEDLTDLSSVLSMINSEDKRADSVLIEALSVYTKTNNLPAKAQVLNELGVLYNRRGNLGESLKYFKESLAVKSKITTFEKEESIIVINNIGAVYQYLGQVDSARHYFSKAVDYAILSERNPAPYFANLGTNYGGQEQYNEAILYFQKALNSLDSNCLIEDFSTNPLVNNATPQLVEFTAYKAHSFHRRYHIDHNLSDLIDGLSSFMVALEMIDTLRFMYSFESKPYLSSEAKIHFFNALDISLDLYHNTGRKEYLAQAFQLSERNKSAILNEFLRTNQAREYLGNVSPWIRQEDSIKQLINKIESDIINLPVWKKSLADSITAMRGRVSNLTDELRNISIKAKRENPDYFRMVYTNHGYPPDEIQKLILPGEALIDYTVVHDERLALDYMIAMVLTKDTLYTYRDTLPTQFREDIIAFRSTITSYVDSKVFQEFSRLSHMMYNYFFAPIEKFAGIKRLIILPDEDLGFLPFEVFVSDTAKPRGSDFRKLSYLNRKYQISYISSHEQLVQFRTNPAKTSRTGIYAFAPFINQGVIMDTLNLLSLKNSGSETDAISKLFKTRVYKNEKAGEQTLRRTFEKESVIILSTHGIMNIARPMESRLLLNPHQPDGSLYLFEMISLKIKSPLVILNACNTGMGRLQVGEGILSLARGLQFAGVPTVITTLWTIDDQSSAAIMKSFFQNLASGMDQGEALMQARNSYLDESTKASGAPYFWAGQVLIGDPGAISIQKPTNRVLMISLLLALSGAILLMFIYKIRR
jgi:CHAT domain-containing protein